MVIITLLLFSRIGSCCVHDFNLDGKDDLLVTHSFFLRRYFPAAYANCDSFIEAIFGNIFIERPD